ncbi:MAG TPA: hypothetical protein DDW14_04195, partial [Spirochaetaceae bacterium]|nr:hypothetical protein [Spirochaetaceae bacterium]
MMKRTVLQMLKEAEQKYPDIPYALKRTDSGYMPTTFKEVRQKARQFAAWLLANDLKAGDRAAIIAEGSPEWLISELGVLSAGMISVPLSIKLLPDEIPFRIQHSEAKVICTTHNQLEKLANALNLAGLKKIDIVYLDDDIEWGQSILKKHKVRDDSFITLQKALSVGSVLLKEKKEYEERL